MKIKWYGHAAFQITTEQGLQIIIDPYRSGAYGGSLSYGKITDEADIVLTSHDHVDHNYTGDIKGSFVHIKGHGAHTEQGVNINIIPVYHDGSKGRERGPNLIHVITADDMVLAHLGDLGHALDAATLAQIGRTDVLFIPVGGYFTIDAAMAAEVIYNVKPAIAIPMHYKTKKCDFTIATADDFLKKMKSVRRVNSPVLDIARATLPAATEVVVLEYAL